DGHRGVHGALAHELEPFDVRVKLVEPGYAPTTRVTSNGGPRMNGLFPEACAAFTEPVLAAFSQVTTVTKESDVAEAWSTERRPIRQGSCGFRPVLMRWPWRNRDKEQRLER